MKRTKTNKILKVVKAQKALLVDDQQRYVEHEGHLYLGRLILEATVIEGSVFISPLRSDLQPSKVMRAADKKTTARVLKALKSQRKERT